jgi:hypothetical protein
MENTLSMRAFAQLAGIELGWAYRLVWAGTVEAERVGGRWRVSESSAMAYARKRRAKREKAEEKQRRRAERRVEQERAQRGVPGPIAWPRLEPFCSRRSAPDDAFNGTANLHDFKRPTQRMDCL